ncbi:connectin-like [Colias croceus]|uniref:connectin-like n=1 Tax=Colias crocea TaxID=72248 RepID=UPI001E27BAAF|nr:connectin-like [Colias croceus]
MKMTATRLCILLCATLIIAEARTHHQKRETKSHLCDPVFNNTNKIQCYCNRDSHDPELVRSAECYPTVEGVAQEDPNWDEFLELENVHKLSFTNTRGIVLKYIPTQALKYTKSLLKLEVKYATIDTVESFDFANLTFVEEMTLRDNQIKVLKTNAFAHHRDLTILTLDSNNVVEINRNVFVDLPSLEKLYLTRNKLTTIHDRAFVHLSNLRELEIDRNNLFSLNSETFSGLKKLEKLDLSSNSLEVIGDNTFLPLKNLQSLNLDGNKIQMLDEKAFNGLSRLQGLSMAHNALSEIKNEKVFIGLKSLRMLSFKGNQIKHLEEDVMAPLLENLYNNVSSLDVEDNIFPCDCRLDWFMSLMNNTQSPHMKLAIENLKCVPSTEIREKWTKTVEAEKNAQDVEDGDVQGNDYEYYDDTQLNGKLFYIDMRFLLNCSANYDNLLKSDVDNTKPKAKLDATSTKTITTNKPISTAVTPIIDRVTKNPLHNTITTKLPHVYENIEKTNDKKQNSYTTSRLSTVSAKPMNNGFFDDHDMASDEGKPDKIKAHRSIQDKIEDKPNSNSGNINLGCVSVLLVIVSFRLLL